MPEDTHDAGNGQGTVLTKVENDRACRLRFQLKFFAPQSIICVEKI